MTSKIAVENGRLAIAGVNIAVFRSASKLE